MKFVAASKLRRAQEGVFAARPYAREILRVLRSAMARIESPAHPLLERRPEERILAIVLTGDRTLCGAFNTNVVKRSLEFLREYRGKKIELIAVGRKGRDALRKRQWSFVAEYLGVSDRVQFGKAKEIAARVAEIYSKGEVDSVYAIYNEFKSVMVQHLRAERILPIAPETFETQKSESSEGHGSSLPMERADSGAMLVDYIYEQPPEEIFKGLVPRYLEAEIFRILLESSAAEHAARMTAMDAATTNAAELIEGLTLEMNKIRQATITRELIEIVSGAASATGS